MQIAEISIGQVTLQPTATTSIRTTKMSDIFKLKDMVLDFDLSFAVPAGQKLVFMNKRGFIDQINIYQDGKRILEQMYLSDQMELMCDFFLETKNQHHGGLFFGRNRTGQGLRYYQKLNNV